MTTYNVFKTPTGDTVEIRTNVGASPLVYVNGVLQTPLGAQNYMYLLKPRLWESVITWLPRKINGRWYWPGSRVYRYRRISPGGGLWIYGDEFDILRDS